MIATEIIHAPNDFDCKTCGAKHCDEAGELPGSIGPASVDIFEIRYPPQSREPFLKSKTCLLPMVDAVIWEYFRLHQHYKNSVLLHAGGIMDQPNLYIEVMEQITECFNYGKN